MNRIILVRIRTIRHQYQSKTEQYNKYFYHLIDAFKAWMSMYLGICRVDEMLSTSHTLKPWNPSVLEEKKLHINNSKNSERNCQNIYNIGKV